MQNRNELLLQQYLVKDNGANLRQIDPGLSLLAAEHAFRGGRIDIVALRDRSPVGIELKASNYQTRAICAQLLNYLNYLSRFGGEVYFIAPKIKYGLYGTLKEPYDSGMLKFFEVRKRGESYSFRGLGAGELDDRQPFGALQEDLQTRSLEVEMLEDKLMKGVDILMRDRRKANLAKSILHRSKPDGEYYLGIADCAVELLTKTTKNRGIETLYRLMKLF